jgi:beta-phosphoglucomutase-like phosphatase (HAD superfamily)
MADVKDQVVETEITEEAQVEQVTKKQPYGFTQEEVDEVIAKRLSREREAIAKKLGVEKYEAVDTFLDQYKTTLSEKEKLNSELTNIKNSLLDKEFRLSALTLGVKQEHVDRAVKLAMTEMNDETSIDQALGLVLNDFPMLKGEEQPVRKIGSQPQSETSNKTEVDRYLDKYKNSKYYNKGE